MKITVREKLFLIVGGSVIALAVLVYLAVLVFPGGEGLTQDVESMKRSLLQRRELLGQEETYKARVEEYRERLKQDAARLFPGENPSIAGAELQKVLKELADGSGVEIIRRDIQREQKVQDNIVKVSVSIETTCLPEQLVQFLAAVENYEKFLTVDELSITSFRIQKRWDIRPRITVSGYVAEAASPAGEKPAGGQ